MEGIKEFRSCIYMTETVRWLSGRKRWFAKPVNLKYGSMGSNPILTANN